MKKCVYIVIAGKYDYPFAHSIRRPDFDYICFTDDETIQSDFWEIRPIPEELKDLSPVRQNRAIKIRPHLYLPDYEYSIYIDANYDLVTYPPYLNTILCVNGHEKRKCLYKEAEVCIAKGKDDPEIINRQIEFYRKCGVPQNYGLWHCHYIARHHNNLTCIAMMEDWWEQVETYSFRDQISFPYVMWKYRYSPGMINYSYQFNPHCNYGRERTYIQPRTYNAEINSRIAVCCVEKLENQYIREFVNHYRSLGFGHIFMYDTNSPEQDDVFEIIGDYIANGYVTLIKWSGKPMLEVRKAFQDCYTKRLNDYDWCLFVDPDEFLELYKDDNITSYLNRLSDYDIIRINWKTMDDNDLIENSGLPLKQRFTRTSNHESDRSYKSLLRTNLSNIDFVRFGSAHGPYSKEHLICDNTGKRITKYINRPFTPECNWDDSALLHYRCKTMEEYIKNKIPKLQGYNFLNFNMRFFFQYNIPTEKKIKAYKQLETKNERF